MKKHTIVLCQNTIYVIMPNYEIFHKNISHTKYFAKSSKLYKTQQKKASHLGRVATQFFLVSSKLTS